MHISKSLVFFIILVLLLISATALQIYSSKRENKWLGLILPIITFSFSLLVVLGFTAYGFESPSEVILAIIPLILQFNIPTIIFIAIYFACREKFKKKKNLDKMNIQDLE